MNDVELTIEDDDGFVTTWPWPANQVMLGNAGFVEVFEALHDAARAAQEDDT